MANLPETPQWEDGIYQIEVSDPVLGGPDGISNRQAKQLASRTSYLKQKVEKSGTDLAAHIAAVDPHTQYATKASPTFTGTPTAPTPANSDNSKKLATTEFVAKALAALAGSAPETLDTLKELADALGNDPNFATTVLNKLAEKLAKDQNGADIPDPALFVKNLGLGTAAKRDVGTGVNQIPDMSFQGYGPNWVKTVGGLIIQKGTLGFGIGSNLSSTTFPIAFASGAVVNLTWSDVTSGGAVPGTTMSYGIVVGSQTRTGFQAWMSGAGGFNLSYIAVGY
ncbi:phage tail protein [Escherichia sp. E1130]|uniref:gp53-like domain-containing protein n=1 Tax=Escherichia sp. E1130 TaxID=2041645 RepID=UPI001F10316E|nr:phage tail protein [Escherichia sp. E1130]